MIAFYLTYEVNPSGKVTQRPRCHRYTGMVTFNKTEVWLYGSNGKPVRKRKVTLFDDSHTPPRLIREDYELKDIRKFKYVDLPLTYVDDRGNIVNAKGETLMEGPR